MSDLPVPCPLHPEVDAEWRCLDCELLQCGSCVRILEAKTAVLEVCHDCGGRVAKPLAAPEVELRDTLELLRRPDAMVMTFALALPGWVALAPIPFVSPAFSVIYFAGVSGYILQIVDHIGRGYVGLPAAGGEGTGLVASIMRGLTVGLACLGPALVYLVWGEPTTVAGGLLGLALLAAGLCWAPAALCAVTLQGTVLAAWWVPQWIAVVRAHPEEYQRTAVAFTGLGLAWLGISWLLVYVLGFVPIIGLLLAATISTHLLWMPAMLVGVFLRRHGEDLGLIMPGRLLVAPPKPPPGPLG